MKKILVVCSNGLGSSLMLKSAIQRACDEHDIDANVEHCDLGSASSMAPGQDLIVTSEALVDELEGLDVPIATIINFTSQQEIKDKVISQLQ